MAARVLIAIDGSKHSDFAVKWYVDVVHQPNDEVLLVHVSEPDVQPVHAFYSNPGMALPKEEWEMIVADFKKKENTIRAKSVDKLKEAGVKKIKFACKNGKPGETLVHTAEEEHCTLLVVGSRGAGKLRRTVMGSVSNYLLHHSKVPVAVCCMD